MTLDELGNLKPRDAARRTNRSSEEELPEPPGGVRCERCREGGLLPIAYVNVDGSPSMGVSCCSCRWGEFYYHIFSGQGMKPTYYDNWPEANAKPSLMEYHEIVEESKRLYHLLRKSRGMPYRNEDGEWIDERLQTVTGEDGIERPNDDIPD
jgi:hypothetical protein